MNIPTGYEDLFEDTTLSFLVLATVRASGEPVAVPVWFVADDRGLLFMTEADSFKARDMRARPRVAGIVMAEGEHKRYVSVRGAASEIVDPKSEGIDPTRLHNRIVQRYEGKDSLESLNDPIFRLVPDRLAGYDYRELDY